MTSFSDHCIKQFEAFQPEIDQAWVYLQLIQKLDYVDTFIKNPIDSKAELYQVYLEYLWLIERLDHPQDTKFYKPHFLPVNGYLEAFFDLSLSPPSFFKAEYLPAGVQEFDWKAVFIAKDGEELEHILSTNIDINAYYEDKLSEHTGFDLDAIAADFLKKLKEGFAAKPVKRTNIEIDEQLPILKRRWRSLTIAPVSSLAMAFLPIAEHQLKLDRYWCEHFELLYLFILDEDMVKPLIRDGNALIFTNSFLGSHSKKDFSGTWQSPQLGSIHFSYGNNTLKFSKLNSVRKKAILERLRLFFPEL